MKQAEMSVTIPTLVGCARCGETHVGLEFLPLTRPVVEPGSEKVEATHWCPCPTNGEPIIMLAFRDVDAEESE